MRLLITSPDGDLLDVTGVDWVNVHLSDGAPISIYTNHAPLVALHAACVLKYRIEDEVIEQPVTRGVLSVSQNTVKCLVEGTSRPSTDKIEQKEE
jgi:F0F1-type ATP synthase epsilon subunit